ncbi:MmpS family transport accessory protein [Actinoplanes sp. GCM10030250]|uniref:MmpS family transport accessory protein n=1 Tax=Actinoplanes sp. GCM10030250 TaxID=3273376 RepID=UPI003620FB48
MTSFDGGASARSDPPIDGTAQDSRHDADDPVRRTPPADPWLTEAHTSVLGDATSLHDLTATGEAPPTAEPPPTDTTPFAAPAPLATAPFAAHAPYNEPPYNEPPRRRAGRWMVAILAACALFIAGMLALDQFGPGDDDAKQSAPSTGTKTVPTDAATAQVRAPTTGARVTPSAGVAAATPSAAVAAANAGAPEVVYEVTASGSRNRGSVSYTDQDGDIIRRNGIPLPWRVTFPASADYKPLVLIAQRTGGGDAGPVTCTITLDGKLLASTTADGKYAAPQCSG